MNTTTKLSSALLSTVLLPLLGACDPAGAIDDADEVTYRCAFCCKTCGLGNGPVANEFPVSTLKTDGTLGPGNVKVVGVRPSHLPTVYTLDVIDDEFVARDAPGGAIVAAGADLVNWKISLELDGEPAVILIKGYDNTIPAWGNSGGVHTAYALNYVKPVINYRYNLMYNVCTGGTSDTSATLISGETYDSETMSVQPNQPGWFTIACDGQAVAKMKMFGFGPNDTVDGEVTATWQERQATLKMLTADYCGDGTSHTEAGTLVSWANSFGTIDPDDPDANLLHEALWTENGAICLDEPRLWDRADVACADALPTCDQIAGEGWVWDTASLGGS